MKVNYENIKYWDQDVMNMYFDESIWRFYVAKLHIFDGINQPMRRFFGYAGNKKPRH